MLDIILPCYNSDSLMLSRALESIADQKTNYPYSVYVIDDGSDGWSVAQSARVRRFRIPVTYRRTAHRGLPLALNVGHQMGTGKYICWTSDDNLLDPDWVETMVSAAESGPYDFARSLERHIPGGEIVDPRHGNSALPVAGLCDGYLGASHLYTRELYNRTAGYDPAIAGAEDLDMYYQMMRLNPHMGFVDRAIYTYRDGSSSFSEARVEEARRKLIAKWGLK